MEENEEWKECMEGKGRRGNREERGRREEKKMRMEL